jgi:hypothetical protein
MKFQLLKSVFVFASLLLAACVSTQAKTDAQPDWVVNEPAKAGMAYGVGSAPAYGNSADALARAKDLAAYALVQKLRVTVNGSFSQDVQENRRTGQETELIQSVRNTVSSKIPEADLRNLEVDSSWVDDKNKVAYILVKLDRVKAEQQLRREISDIDMQLTELAQTPTNLPTLNQLQKLLPALKTFAQRDRLADQAQLVSVNARRPQPDDVVNALNKRIYDLLDKLVVTLDAENDAGRALRSGLVEHMTKTGLRVTNTANPDLRLRFSAELPAPIVRNGNYYVLANGSMRVEDVNGRVLSEFRKEAKGVSAASETVARQKAVANLADELGQEFADTLVEKID